MCSNCEFDSDRVEDENNDMLLNTAEVCEEKDDDNRIVAQYIAESRDAVGRIVEYGDGSPVHDCDEEWDDDSTTRSRGEDEDDWD